MPSTMHTIDVYIWDTLADIVSNSIPVGTPARDGAFIMDSGETSVDAESIVLEGRPQVLWNAVGLFDIAADSATVEIVNGPVYSSTKNLKHPDPLSDDFPNILRCVWTDLPDVDPVAYPTAFVRVTLSAPGRLAHLGFLTVGPRTNFFACVLYGTSISITDYSRKERDTFGNIDIIERGYSNLVNYALAYDDTLLDQIRDYLASRRVALTVYVGLVDDPKTICLGYYEDFNIGLEPGPVSEGTLIVDSVVYDKGANWSEYEIVWGTYDAATCDYEGDYKFVELVAGLPTETALAAVKDRVILPGDVVTWRITRLEGHPSGNASSSSIVTTPCGDLAVWQWPAAAPSTQNNWRIKLSAKLFNGANGITYDVKPAVLYVGSDKCSSCLPDLVAPAWSTGGQSETGAVGPADPMVEVPANTQVPIDNAAAGHRYFWIELPDNFGNCTITTTFATGTSMVYAKLWNPCDGVLPDENSPYSGESIFIAVPYAERNDWTAILVRIDDGAYTGTIERIITLQLPT